MGLTPTLAPRTDFPFPTQAKAAIMHWIVIALILLFILPWSDGPLLSLIFFLFLAFIFFTAGGRRA